MDQQHEINLSKEQWKTRQTLIARARDPNDSQAWDEFAGYYAGFIRMVLMQLHTHMAGNGHPQHLLYALQRGGLAKTPGDQRRRRQRRATGY
jgi:hypothetical protein